jgi:hypothetical protein
MRFLPGMRDSLKQRSPSAKEGSIDFEDAVARLRLTTFRFNERLIADMRARLKT